MSGRETLAVLVEDASVRSAPAGAFEYFQNSEGKIAGLVFNCPCGCRQVGGLDFDLPGVPSPKWQWDGNEAKPTLTPSIHRTNGCRWHGFLTNGVFREC